MKRARYGSDVECWGDRTERSTIAAQLALGCKCGCIDAYANLGDVCEARSSQAKKSPAERREFVRSGAEGCIVVDYTKRIGYALTWGDGSRQACVTGFAARHGFEEGWM